MVFWFNKAASYHSKSSHAEAWDRIVSREQERKHIPVVLTLFTSNPETFIFTERTWFDQSDVVPSNGKIKLNPILNFCGNSTFAIFFESSCFCNGGIGISIFHYLCATLCYLQQVVTPYQLPEIEHYFLIKLLVNL